MLEAIYSNIYIIKPETNVLFVLYLDNCSRTCLNKAITITRIRHLSFLFHPEKVKKSIAYFYFFCVYA